MRALLIALLLLVCGGPAVAQTFPALSGRVVDAANIIPPAEEAALTERLAALDKARGRQFVVATIPSLEGREIEDYGYRLGRAWGIGSEKLDDGLVLIVAPNERRVRIEVGYGLEGIVTDALSSVIVQTRILPAFREGDMPCGIADGAGALIDLLMLPDDQADARARALVGAERAQGRERGDGGLPIALIFWLILLIVVLAAMRKRGGRGRRHGNWPVILWGPGLSGGGGGGSSWGGGGGGGGFSGGGGSFGGGGASGSW